MNSKDLINSYRLSAKALHHRIKELAAMINDNTSSDELTSLKARKELLEEERYDLLDTANFLENRQSGDA